MRSELGVRLALWLLDGTLPIKTRHLLTRKLLDGLGALPLADIIYTDAETKELVINGRIAEVEEIRRLRETARSALNNPALKLIREQVAYIASVMGSAKAVTIDDLQFTRAALWWGQEEDRILKTLAQRLDTTEQPEL